MYRWGPLARVRIRRREEPPGIFYILYRAYVCTVGGR